MFRVSVLRKPERPTSIFIGRKTGNCSQFGTDHVMHLRGSNSRGMLSNHVSTVEMTNALMIPLGTNSLPAMVNTGI